MSVDQLDESALTSVALEVARAAGALALEGSHGRLQVEEKGRWDLVTQWDVKTERQIRELLAERTPGIAVIGEEEGGRSSAGPVWYADPIDGTTNFVHGHPFWCVSIGLVSAGRPLLGAVVAPALGWEWWGRSSGGSFKNGAACRVSENAEIERALVATGFPRDRRFEPDNNFSSFVSVKRVVSGVRRCGAAAMDLCMVADGTYDAYWERQLKPWDLSAGAAIVLGAGGRVSDLRGGPARIETGEIAASNNAVHDALLPLIVTG